jgi:predicted metal-dependent HD superfamily phosphohydrolase
VTTFLERHWTETGLPLVPVYSDLLARYSEPHRAYHTTQHLTECFGHLDSVVASASDPVAIALALWFHDAIYDTSRHDNETRSAELAASALAPLGVSSGRLTAIHELILVTRHDAVPARGDASLLVDIDLSILGADPARFDEYECQVREEYKHVSEPDFRRGRAQILSAFLARLAIYSTEFFQTRLEQSARHNLARSLGKLAP